jgi:acyl-CoA thioester hydrolase
MNSPERPSGAFCTQVRVRYQDTDAAGVVYYANHLAYFEVARVDLLRVLGLPIGEVQRRGVLLPVIEAHCRYLRPALLDDLLDVHVWPTEVGHVRFAFAYEICRGAELLAVGSTRHVVLDQSSRRAVAVPAWIAELFGRMAELEEKS